ncbi:hypothetical protein [Lysobacter antibioticus]|uniref:hypothetical protein n=1 Tax=Lysobacter antibioticus TaxID=84531 RepID=UPI000716678F|nr:hypothetical protein [Lysobacter antibioticus]
MNDRVKVGLNEWMVADAGTTDLVTDGLSGCVAVGLAGNGKVALSHVYSGCDSEKAWGDYHPKLEAALESSGLGDLRGKKAVLVCAQGENAAGQDGWLPGKLKTWLESKGAVVETRQDNGCRISAAADVVASTLKKHDTAENYSHGYQTSRDYGLSADPSAEAVTLSKLGKPCYPAALAQARETPSESAPALVVGAGKPAEPVLVNDKKHPMHGLYSEILGKMPGDAFHLEEGEKVADLFSAQQAAAALTVACMKRGIYGDIDEVKTFVPRGKEDTMLSATERGTSESRTFAAVNLEDVCDMSMSKLSTEAASLHAARMLSATPSNSNPSQTVGGASTQHL